MDHAEMLRLSPWDFDQSPNGWRSIQQDIGYEKAANLIIEYISQNKERILNPKEGEKKVSIKVMYFHIGQLLAMTGPDRYAEAVEYFRRGVMEGAECWNAYVNATIGFLEGDQQKIEQSIQKIMNSNEQDKRGGNIGIVKNFLKALNDGEYSYERAYSMPKE